MGGRRGKGGRVREMKHVDAELFGEGGLSTLTIAVEAARGGEGGERARARWSTFNSATTDRGNVNVPEKRESGKSEVRQ